MRAFSEARQSSESNNPTIVVVDAHAFARNCLGEVLRKGFLDLAVQGIADAADLNHAQGQDIRLIALNIGDKPVTDAGVLKALSTLSHARPDIPIALLSERDDEAMISQAVRHGVKGFVPTTLPLAVIVAILGLVLAGGVYVPVSRHPQAIADAIVVPASDIQDAASPIVATMGVPGANQVDRKFTPREEEVLAALQEGRSNKVIAHELGLSENTVKVHIHRILRKLRASNRTEAVLISQQHRSSSASIPTERA